MKMAARINDWLVGALTPTDGPACGGLVSGSARRRWVQMRCRLPHGDIAMRTCLPWFADRSFAARTRLIARSMAGCLFPVALLWVSASWIVSGAPSTDLRL